VQDRFHSFPLETTSDVSSQPSMELSTSTQTPTEDPEGPHRIYKDWPSKNEFLCGGRLIHGPDRYYFWASSLALIVGGGCFLIFVSREIFTYKIIPSPGWTYAFIPIFTVAWVYTIVMHNVVAYMDPGILRRQAPPKMPDTDDPYLIGTSSPPVSKNLTVKGTTIIVKWCPTCNLYRPPRAIHCGICDNCVHRFDHHCPYVGNCVGLRNYRFFVLFIFGVFFCSIFAFSHSVCLIAVRSVQYKGITGAFNAGQTAFIFAWLVGILTFVSMCLVGALIGLTSFLISNGRTTNENIKHAFPTKNPFHLGCLSNWFVACCPPFYPRAIDPRALIVKLEEV